MSIQTKVFDSLEDFLDWFDQVGDKVMITQTIYNCSVVVFFSDYAFEQLQLALPKVDS